MNSNFLLKDFVTLCVFRSLLPKRIKEKKSFSQIELATDYLKKEEITVTHNALNDVMMLQKLIKILCKSDENLYLSNNTKSIDYLLNKKERL